MTRIIFLLALLWALPDAGALAATFTIGNQGPLPREETPPASGADGECEILIIEELDDGRIRASDGSFIAVENIIEASEEARISISKSNYRHMKIILPDNRQDEIVEMLADGNFKSALGKIITPDGQIAPDGGYIIPANPEPAIAEEGRGKAEEGKEEKEGEKEEKKAAEKESANKQQTDIAELLSSDNLLAQMAGSEKETVAKNAKAERESAKEDKKSVKTGKKTVVRESKERKVRKGDKFTIPATAAAKKDLSFMEGCWRSDALTYYTGFRPYHAPAEMCFDANGNGSFISYIDGGKCKARAWARFGHKKLDIKATEGPCSGTGLFGASATLQRFFECEGVGQNTECYILAQDKDFAQRRFKSRARFYRK